MKRINCMVAALALAATATAATNNFTLKTDKVGAQVQPTM